MIEEKKKKKVRHSVYVGGKLNSEWLSLKHLWVSRSRVNDCVSLKCLEKTGGPKNLYARAESAKADVPPTDTSRKGEDASFFSTVVGKTLYRNTAEHEPRKCAPKVALDLTYSADKPIWNTKENQKENSWSVSLFYFSP